MASPRRGPKPRRYRPSITTSRRRRPAHVSSMPGWRRTAGAPPIAQHGFRDRQHLGPCRRQGLGRDRPIARKAPQGIDTAGQLDHRVRRGAPAAMGAPCSERRGAGAEIGIETHGARAAGARQELRLARAELPGGLAGAHSRLLSARSRCQARASSLGLAIDNTSLIRPPPRGCFPRMDVDSMAASDTGARGSHAPTSAPPWSCSGSFAVMHLLRYPVPDGVGCRSFLTTMDQ